MKTYIGQLGKWIERREAARLAEMAKARGIKAGANGSVVDFGVKGYMREYGLGPTRNPFLFGILAETRRRT